MNDAERCRIMVRTDISQELWEQPANAQSELVVHPQGGREVSEMINHFLQLWHDSNAVLPLVE